MATKIGAAFILASAASSAFAYQIASQTAGHDMHGSDITTYAITCNSGATKSVVKSHGSLGQWVYEVSTGSSQYTSLDPAAKKACNE